MDSHNTRLLATAGLIGVAAALSACSSFEGEKINYKSATSVQSLDVPPDLTQLTANARYVAPSKTVTASAFQKSGGVGTAAAASPVAASKVADVRLERQGHERWLVVPRPAEQVWPSVREFWIEGGFVLTTDQATLGIMETDWAENRAKLPQDFIRKSLGKVLDVLYSTGERDRFRTRLERRSDGGTDIFVSHRGMVEVYSDKLKEHTMWQPRPADPELESEFLRRLMQKLGGPASATTADSGTTTPGTPSMARESSVQSQKVADGSTVLVMSEEFDRAWRRVGLSLDRAGFTVEDRDRNAGTYFVRYVPQGTSKNEPGFFAKLFSSSGATPQPYKYKIALRTESQKTTISVLAVESRPDDATHVAAIIKALAAELQ